MGDKFLIYTTFNQVFESKKSDRQLLINIFIKANKERGAKFFYRSKDKEVISLYNVHILYVN